MIDASNAELRAILDAVVDGIATLDRHGTILSVNSGITSESEQVLGRLNQSRDQKAEKKHDGCETDYDA